MNCKEIEEISERYLLDRLSETERDEFEKHYFECESCFSRVQTGLAIQEELRRQPSAPVKQWMWTWAPAFVAVALLVALVILWNPRHQQSPQVASPSVSSPGKMPQMQPSLPAVPSFEELARVEAPPYSAVVLRGAEDEAQTSFGEAMQHYVKRDYSKSIPALRAAIRASPQTAKYYFYLGACYLLTGQSDMAIASLRKTVSLGDPAYSEPAHFYLAKAYLGKKDIPAAEKELATTVRLRGDRAAEAQEILSQLRR